MLSSFSSNWQDGRVGLRRTVQVNLIPMVHNCLRVSKGAWVQIPLLSYLFCFLFLYFILNILDGQFGCSAV
ncbi:hypothetical protein N7452_011243 [Penicillium brevicompactum]|uniref:Uncharacterized protein n=1 Tax=Penicillium brevicompactum TaxID=5074 RepID=A0A9W9U8W8_PENBR|nr:hypothetical protein N7452_011243 [Penicillium brevicompactum]